ncbi:hypothetical protein BU24DRAFT_458724 [Aaosphaeria arxii CBS 175.79]|uniref:Methyltransferase type 11 domain-containing protein n=1 Tax=Aaosphaeria arxii CBS 175.79 TaxID=1450172 RepID=A0A6A5Y0E8_9PLEO|nr:uncharacterized protein BU24DRAFT_458724 [Aaosphaeria arxii CBS 175.79]KAF2019005.1 hypothetical protein BU24DRAFT_458724 [Aaosphaeria arxii CBS 175.79]
MFSADLSWTDPGTERVGERRERLAKEHEHQRSISSASGEGSIKSSRSSKSKSSKSSAPVDKDQWWPTGFRKSKSIKSSKKNNLLDVRPISSRDSGQSMRLLPSRDSGQSHRLSTPIPATATIDHNLGKDARDVARKPKYTLSLSPTLPSGAPLDPFECDVPELEGDLSSQRTNSSGSRSSRRFTRHEDEADRMMLKSPPDERQLKYPGKIKIIDHLSEHQQLSPSSYVARTIMSKSEIIDPSAEICNPVSKTVLRRPYSVKIEGCPSLDELKIEEQPETRISPKTDKHPSYASGLQEGDLVAWRPPSDWNILLPNPSESTLEKGVRPDHSTAASDVHTSSVELTRFQRFIRRMESAGPKVILDRMKEEWNNPVDDEAGQEMMLEKQLWVLTAFQLQNLGRYSRFPKANTGNILELYGNLSEVYQLSAMHPRQRVHYLTNQAYHQETMTLPNNVNCLTVPEAATLPLPYADSTFSHIRASTLPSLVPSATLPKIFQECYRVLAPGGMLEIRIMDAAPLRKTSGPKMKAWIEDRLSLNLERLFRCSKPCTLVPGWIADAGFQLPAINPTQGEQSMRMPCAYDAGSNDIDAELSCLVGRALWKDIWGQFVDDEPGESRWWWEDEEVMKECLERGTVLDCGAIFAFKN